jgi:hypothetical protein
VSVFAGSVIVFVSVLVIAAPPELVLESVVAAITVPIGPAVATTQASAIPAATAAVNRPSTRARRDLKRCRLSRLRSHRNSADTTADGVRTRFIAARVGLPGT